ncbi:hypothetical protein ACU4GD_07765 [Cupriavidus basilensis]
MAACAPPAGKARTGGGLTRPAPGRHGRRLADHALCWCLRLACVAPPRPLRWSKPGAGAQRRFGLGRASAPRAIDAAAPAPASAPQAARARLAVGLYAVAGGHRARL